ncbi:hypothetical protein GCM10010912_40040 [Paenibacillus albidus]|uniref:Uncharacterized protein n=1 Tax=Paenibacillus albidus TaxID=2041023 RepID=A0A917FN48_9BACL|nr:hypothetical protein GCM10010912_40040 [Paenibacillus albidus]
MSVKLTAINLVSFLASGGEYLIAIALSKVGSSLTLIIFCASKKNELRRRYLSSFFYEETDFGHNVSFIL